MNLTEEEKALLAPSELKKYEEKLLKQQEKEKKKQEKAEGEEGEENKEEDENEDDESEESDSISDQDHPGYEIFGQQRKPGLKKEKPNLSEDEIIEEYKKEWQNLKDVLKEKIIFEYLTNKNIAKQRYFRKERIRYQKNQPDLTEEELNNEIGNKWKSLGKEKRLQQAVLAQLEQTSYYQYVQDVKRKFQFQHQDETYQFILKQIEDSWKILTKEEKEEFNQKSKDYQNEQLSYFAQRVNQKYFKDNPSLSTNEIHDTIKEKWANLSQKEKQPFLNQLRIRRSAEFSQFWEEQNANYKKDYPDLNAEERIFKGIEEFKFIKKDKYLEAVVEEEKQLIQLFKQEKEIELKLGNPDISVIEIDEKVEQDWADLTIIERKDYELQQFEEKQQFKHFLADEKENILEKSPEIDDEKILEQVTSQWEIMDQTEKRQYSDKELEEAQQYFSAIQRDRLKNDYPDLTEEEIEEKLQNLWKILSDAERYLYVEKMQEQGGIEEIKEKSEIDIQPSVNVNKYKNRIHDLEKQILAYQQLEKENQDLKIKLEEKEIELNLLKQQPKQEEILLQQMEVQKQEYQKLEKKYKKQTVLLKDRDKKDEEEGDKNLATKMQRTIKKTRATKGNRKQKIKFLMDIYEELKVGDTKLKQENMASVKQGFSDIYNAKFPPGMKTMPQVSRRQIIKQQQQQQMQKDMIQQQYRQEMQKNLPVELQNFQKQRTQQQYQNQRNNNGVNQNQSMRSLRKQLPPIIQENQQYRQQQQHQGSPQWHGNRRIIHQQNYNQGQQQNQNQTQQYVQSPQQQGYGAQIYNNPFKNSKNNQQGLSRSVHFNDTTQSQDIYDPNLLNTEQRDMFNQNEQDQIIRQQNPSSSKQNMSRSNLLSSVGQDYKQKMKKEQEIKNKEKEEIEESQNYFNKGWTAIDESKIRLKKIAQTEKDNGNYFD